MLFTLWSINSYSQQTRPKLSPKQQKPWTILVFMNGDNDLEGAAIDDINEMESAIDTSLYNIVVEIDRHPGYDNSNGDWTTTRDYYILPDSDPSTINSYLIWDGGELNMGDPQTLIDFANYYIDELPADNYALIIWDHGDGWYKNNNVKDPLFKGISSDETDDDVIGVANGEYYSALNSISSHLGYQIDLLAHDACLMGMIEVAYEAKDFASVLVFSEHTEPGDGYPYDEILLALNYDPYATPSALASYIVNSYTQSYNPDGSQYCYQSATQSAIYTDSNFESLISNINNFAQELINAGGVENNDIISARDIIQEYNESTHIDLYDFAIEIENKPTLPLSLKNSAAIVKNSISNVLIAEGHFSDTSDNFYVDFSHGLAIYYPVDAPLNLDTTYSSLHFTDDYINWWNFLRGIEVGMGENTYTDNSIRIYPNPTNEIIKIESNRLFDNITITNVLGDVVYNSDFKPKINISDLPTGIYILRLSAEGETSPNGGQEKEGKILRIEKIVKY